MMLSDLDRQILDFERVWWKYADADARLKTAPQDGGG